MGLVTIKHTTNICTFLLANALKLHFIVFILNWVESQILTRSILKRIRVIRPWPDHEDVMDDCKTFLIFPLFRAQYVTGFQFQHPGKTEWHQLCLCWENMDIGYGVLAGYLAGQRCESVRCTKLTSYSRSLRNAVNEHEGMKHQTLATPWELVWAGF